MSHYFNGHYYTADALKSAYRDLCKANHPDRANQRMQEINGEYEILQAQLKRDGVEGWSIKQDKQPHAEVKKRDDPPPVVRRNNKVSQAEIDDFVARNQQPVRPSHSAWTWDEVHAESHRIAEESLQAELNRMSNWIYDR